MRIAESRIFINGRRFMLWLCISIFLPGMLQAGDKRVRAITLEQAPQIDGKLEPVWKSASRITSFERLGGGKLTQNTEVYVGFHQLSLYLAFVCHENRMDDIVAAARDRDSIIYGDDCVEVFINPDADFNTYFQFQINSRGTFTDRSCEFAKTGQLFKRSQWNANNVQVAAQCYSDRWVAELKLPLAALGIKWRPDLNLGFNVTRAENPHRETASWASMGTTFHDPKRFGRLWFMRGAFIDQAYVLSRKAGIVNLKIKAVNTGDEKLSANMVFVFTNPQEGELRKQKQVMLEPGKATSMVYEHAIGYGGCKRIKIELRNAESNTILDSSLIILDTEHFKPGISFATPHTKWAMPSPGGKLKVLFLLDYFHLRDISELAQRMDLDYIAPIFIRGYWTYPEKPSPGEYREQVRRALAGQLDVIVLEATQKGKGGDSRTALPGELTQILMQKVKQGTGLIVYAQPGLPAAWQNRLLTGCDKSRPAGSGRLQVVKDHYLVSGMPLPAFDELRIPCFATGNTVLMTAGSRSALAVNQYGKGRIVILGKSRNGMVPSSRSAPAYMQWQPMPTYRYWDYWFAFLAKCVTWAAGRNPDVIIKSLTADREVCRLVLGNSGNTEQAIEVSLTLRDKFSRKVFSSSTRCVVAAEKELGIELPFAVKHMIDGKHFAEITVARNGKRVNWGTAVFVVNTPAKIEKIEPTDDYIYQADTPLRASLTIKRLPGDDMRGLHLKIILRDRMGRTINARTDFPCLPEAATVDVEIPLVNPVWRSFVIEANLLAGKRVLDRCVSRPIYYIPQRKINDFSYFVWNWSFVERHPDYTRDYFYRHLLDCGFTGIENHYSLDLPILEGMKYLADKHSPAFKAQVERLGRLYRRTGDVKCLSRIPCLHEHAAFDRLCRNNLKKLRPLLPQKPIGYFFGDEDTLTYEGKPIDFCFSSESLAAFRAWLRGQYGNIDALNHEWGTNFKIWDQVIPMTKEQVRERDNYAPWADHRHFMQIAWTAGYARCRQWLRKFDPAARTGACGTRPLAAYTGIDWYRQLQVLDFLIPYSLVKNQAEIHRSFSNCPKIMASGLLEGRRQSYFIWKAALNGCCGIIMSKTTYALRPDLSMTSKARFNRRIMGELTSGLGKFIVTSKRDQGKIGIYYSPASCFASWIREYRFGRIQQWRGPFHRSREAWLKLVQSLGLQCRFVHPLQVTAGFLDTAGIRVLILPYTMAMSDEEIKAIIKFVQQGGTLIADYLPAIMDQHCRPRNAGGLDELFGVRSHMPTTDYIGGEAIISGKTYPAIVGRRIASGLAGNATLISSGSALGRFVTAGNRGRIGEIPVLIRNRNARGQTLLLNFLYDYRADYTDPAGQVLDHALLRLLGAVAGEAGLSPPVRINAAGRRQAYCEVVPYARDKIRAYFILQDYLFPQGEDELHKEAVELTFAEPGQIYDIRRGCYLGSGNSIAIKLAPGSTTAVAVLPYKVTAVRVHGPGQAKPGESPAFEIAIITGGDKVPGEHVLRLEVSGPDGRIRRYYAQNLEAPEGETVFRLPLAMNDSPGTWTVTVRDVITGMIGKQQFVVVGAGAQKIRPEEK